MRKLVTLGLVVPMMLLVALGAVVTLSVAAEERDDLNRDLNRTLNESNRGDRDVDTTIDADLNLDSEQLAATTDDVPGRSSRLNDVDRSGATRRVSRRGPQAARGNTVFSTLDSRGYDDEDEGGDEDEDEDDDEDMSPSYPQPIL